MATNSNHRYHRTLLDRGGMASIYKVTDNQGQQPPWVEKYTLPEHLHWAKQEFRALSDLRDCHRVVKVYHFYQQNDGGSAIQMEYIDGKTLAQQNGSIDVSLKAIADVLTALKEAWKKEIVHRDVKPDNIMVTKDSTGKLLDFGVARYLNSPDLVEDGCLVGTPGYIATELARGGDVTPAADVFAVAGTLYKLITGELPFLSKEESELPYKDSSKLALRRASKHKERDLKAMKEVIQKIIPSQNFVNAWGRAFHPDPNAREYLPLDQEVRRFK